VRVLVTGDLTGPRAMREFIAALPGIRARHRLDAVVVIGDNTAITGPTPMGGSGMTVADRDALIDAGADLILTGAHVWDAGHGHAAVDHPRVLRCANLADSCLPGSGVATLAAGSEQLAVVQIGDPHAIAGTTQPFQCWLAIRPAVPTIVHFVADVFHATVFAHLVDGQCAAVINSMSHVACRDLRFLPNGTAFVADVGYVGPPGGVGGFEPDHFVAAYLGRDVSSLEPYRLTDGPTEMSAVLADVDTARARVREMSWVRSLDGPDS
jgi:2',3'-cyclic-nucleotide 2'-phosphodiesterase